MPLPTLPATLEMLPGFAKQEGDIVIAQSDLCPRGTWKAAQGGLAMIIVLVLALSPFLISALHHSLTGQALLTQPNGLEW